MHCPLIKYRFIIFQAVKSLRCAINELIYFGQFLLIIDYLKLIKNRR